MPQGRAAPACQWSPSRTKQKRPQVTGTQRRRGAEPVLSAPTMSLRRSNLLCRRNSCEKCTSGQIPLPDFHGDNTIMLQTRWKIFSVGFSAASSSILRCCRGTVLRDYVCSGLLDPFLLSAFIFDKHPSFMCLHLPFLLVFTLTASKQ